MYPLPFAWKQTQKKKRSFDRYEWACRIQQQEDRSQTDNVTNYVKEQPHKLRACGDLIAPQSFSAARAGPQSNQLWFLKFLCCACFASIKIYQSLFPLSLPSIWVSAPRGFRPAPSCKTKLPIEAWSARATRLSLGRSLMWMPKSSLWLLIYKKSVRHLWDSRRWA